MSYRSESHSPVCRQAEDRRGRIIIEKEREGFGVDAFANRCVGDTRPVRFSIVGSFFDDVEGEKMWAGLDSISLR